MRTRQRGQDVIEFGLLICVVVLLVLLTVPLLGGGIYAWFAQLATRVTTA